MDCAVARLDQGVSLVAPQAPGFAFDPSRPPAKVAKKTLVRKIGRTTAMTTGLVTAAEVGGFFVDYQNGPALFEHQLEVTGLNGPVAAHGDSGALVVNENGAAVGLLFAVSETGVAYVNPIAPALEMLACLSAEPSSWHLVEPLVLFT